MKKDILLFIISILLILQYGASGCAVLPIFQDDSEQAESGYEWNEDDYRPGDIFVGMDMRGVRSNWGEPRRIYRAGTSHKGNQKWEYSDPASARWGMGPVRTVYFENGRVTGWETTENSGPAWN